MLKIPNFQTWRLVIVFHFSARWRLKAQCRISGLMQCTSINPGIASADSLT